MAKHSAPDPDGVDLLAEAVNDVYRGMVLTPDAIFPPPSETPFSVSDFSPEAREALATIHEFTTNPEMAGRPYVIALTAYQAGEVLTMAAGLAYAHQYDDHPGKPWVGCEPHTSIMAHACRVFLLALGQGEL